MVGVAGVAGELEQQIEALAAELHGPDSVMRRIPERRYRVALLDQNDELRRDLASLLRRRGHIAEEIDSRVLLETPQRHQDRYGLPGHWDALMYNADQGRMVDAFAHGVRMRDPDLPIFGYAQSPTSFIGNGESEIVPLYLGEMRTLLDRRGTMSELRTPDRENLPFTFVLKRLSECFWQINLDQLVPIVKKDGGSTFDLVDEKRDLTALVDHLEYSWRVKRANFFLADIETPGGGKLNDNIKGWRESHPEIWDRLKPGDPTYEQIVKELLKTQALKMHDILGPERSVVLDPDHPGKTLGAQEEIGAITDSTFRRIVIVPYAFREYRTRHPFASVGYSDDQTLLIAHAFGVRRVAFIKDVPGNRIRLRDPNVHGTGPDNPALREIEAYDLLRRQVEMGGRPHTISRVGGDQRDQHLIEDSALLRWIASAPYTPLKRIVVAHPRTKGLLEDIFVENNLRNYSSIVLRYAQQDRFPPRGSRAASL